MIGVEALRETTFAHVDRIRDEFVESGLPRSAARLYSQHTLLGAGQPGLETWSTEEAEQDLDDAVMLADAAMTLRARGDGSWRDLMRRAAELLEWLSHDGMGMQTRPTDLLAAAMYQLAGYPARSAGVLNRTASQDRGSAIIRSLLAADFPALMASLIDFWSMVTDGLNAEGSRVGGDSNRGVAIEQWITEEVVRSLGVFCSAIRWGNEDRIGLALGKLSSTAKVMLHADDAYSWLLARLVAEVCSELVSNSLRVVAAPLLGRMTEDGVLVLEQYARFAFLSRRAIAWPSQRRGIEQLATARSFALCTPTGSGKTAVAELAILQSLYSASYMRGFDSDHSSIPLPLAMYLVPTRALAAEVEAKLARVVRSAGEMPVTITGLYGGTDWGPTDAWLTSTDRTVLICTYEKADALLRFLGPLFLARLSLVVLDEAHSVQFSARDLTSLARSENRSLRLESLVSRLLIHIEGQETRVVALSAVAGRAETSLARWLSGEITAQPASVQYRSTRQLIGRLLCLPNRRFHIRYDVLDGDRLVLSDREGEEAPYVADPFPRIPEATGFVGPEKGLRPHLFWAAMHLAGAGESLGTTDVRPGVLISIAQQPGGYANDLLSLLDGQWSNLELPEFFTIPEETSESFDLWQRALRSCADYFGSDSREYRLLSKGIVLHHGKMPGLMARFLVELIEKRVIRLVLATSTLSEGVNLPFETILIPTLRRFDGALQPAEVLNLAGRAGRPGVAAEGRTLVLLDQDPRKVNEDYRVRQTHERYATLVDGIQHMRAAAEAEDGASPLAALIEGIEGQWSNITNSTSWDDFLAWLEVAAPVDSLESATGEDDSSPLQSLDALDGLLLASIEELDRLSLQPVDHTNLEDRLRHVWSQTYARYASARQEVLERAFLTRGTALKERIYPSAEHRRRLYRTSLPPRQGQKLVDVYPVVRERLLAGGDYARWESQERLEFVLSVFAPLERIDKFRAQDLTNGSRRIDWRHIFSWWMSPSTSAHSPTASQVTNWHRHASENFVYRFSWGMGSVIALAIDDVHGAELKAPSLEEWSETGLPWIALWLKELLTWGTLDPVAAYLLARGMVATRSEAEAAAKLYYGDVLAETDIMDELLSPVAIGAWISERYTNRLGPGSRKAGDAITVTLSRNFEGQKSDKWRVLPVTLTDGITWIDPAGYELAKSPKPDTWKPEWTTTMDFTLNIFARTVSFEPYL